MNIEIPCITTSKNTNLIRGTETEQLVLHKIRESYNLSSYVVELHLVCPSQTTPRSLASEVSLRKKMKILEAIGVISRVYVHPLGVPASIFDRSIDNANRDQAQSLL